MGVLLIIVGVLLIGFVVYQLMYPGRKSSVNTEDRVNEIQSKYDPLQTRQEARKEIKSAVVRTELASTLGGEARAVTDMVKQQKERETAEFERSTAVEKLEQRHKVDSLLLENQANVLEAANQDKLPLPVYVARKESEVRIEEHRQLKDIDLEVRWKEILQDSNAADLAQIGDHLVTKKLLSELQEARRERHAIRIGDEPEDLKQELLTDYDKFISRLEAKIHERETGHSLPADRPKARALTEGKANSRPEYPPETDEDSE